MFDLLITEQQDTPLYQRIYDEIREQIHIGRLQGGMRLPSVRSLAIQLNSSKTPIETAYQMLLAEGYVLSVPRSGLYIADYDRLFPTEPSRPFNSSPTPGRPEEPLHLPAPPTAVDFNPTSLDPALFPFRTWSKLLKQSLEHFAGDMGKYGDPQGEWELRTAVAQYLWSSRGVNCLPEQIVIGSGMAYSIGILIKLLPGLKRVAMEEPGYNLVRDQFVLNGYGIDPIEVRKNGIEVSDLWTSSAQAVYVTPSHQFPTGGILPYPDRERLLDWAAERGAYVVEDDYAGEFRYSGKPIPSLQSLDRRDRVIYIGTFSKAVTPALRLNYMVLPPALLETLRSMPYEILFAPSRIEQWAMYLFIEQGHWHRHIRKMRNTYRRKHRHLLALIALHLGDLVEVTGEHAGLHLQLAVKTRQSAQSLVKLAAGAGVAVYDFHKMWMGEKPIAEKFPNVFLGFAGIGLQEMETGIRLLRKAWFEGFIDDATP